ncbi:acetate--CoA ligase family protein [Streptomyces sp. NPDC050856]|uniref:acetate--CoA ligase family protein n=1 Tax=Streptomyces sp. NPDC050856 TaxID=3154939 RepID=UPI0034072DAC
MLGSTHGTFTTGPGARVVACGRAPGSTVHGVTAAEGDLDVSGRPLYAPVPELDRLFRPGSVAVVGASDTEGHPDAALTRSLLRWAERVGARPYPVGPARPSVFGVPCVPTVADLPEPVDVAVILGGDPLTVIGELAAAKAGFAVALASGATGPGEAGAAARDGSAAAAGRPGPRLLGPGGGLGVFAEIRDDLDGPAIALITRTALQGRSVHTLQELGVRLSHWACTGDGADLGAADLIAYFTERPEVGAIACYLEGIGDGRSFLLAADRAARRGVPVVAVRAGRTATGTGPATAGGPAGADQVVDAAMRQYGVVQVTALDQLGDTAALLARARGPVAEGVAVYAPAGGTGAHVADLAAAAGLALPALARSRQDELRRWIPGHLGVANPVDGGAGPDGDRHHRRIIDTILADPAVGVLICPVGGASPAGGEGPARDLVAAARTTDKLVCAVWESPLGTEPAYRETLLGSSRVATFRTAGNCVTAVRAYLDHHRFTAAYRSPFDEAPRTPSPSYRKARALLHPGHRLSEHAAKQLLRAYGIRVPREQLVTSAAAAVRAAGLVGYPVVMKVSAPQPPHKTELGLVKVGLTSAGQVRDTYRELIEIARYEGIGLEGVLVCQMVERGVETAVGVRHDPLFGPTVTVGLGGALAEVLPDTAVRVPPFGAEQARAMLGELPARTLLDGVRGARPKDVDALVEVVLRVQRMALELGGELAELAIDPLMVLERGQGAMALDALAVCR